MKMTIRTLLYVLVVFCLMAVTVQASEVVIEFTTTAYVQKDTYGDLEGIIENGAEVRGRIVYDTESPSLYKYSWLEKYRSISFTIEIGEDFIWSAYSSAGHGIVIEDNRTVGPNTFDKFVIRESGEATFAGKTIPGEASVYWRDLTCLSFDSTSLPTADELSDFAVEQYHFVMFHGQRWRISRLSPMIWTIAGATSDVDGDGIEDNDDAFPDDPNEWSDSDGDGVGDNADICLGFDDFMDSDGEGIPDGCDVCPSDIGNDADADGLCESNDNCPLVSNSNQLDNDSDGMGDACDLDDDDDGIDDGTDNCHYDYNPNQDDLEADGIGDICDTDYDGDGVLDADDQCLPTEPGNTANTDGCSIAQLCLEKPLDFTWKNHGAYVSCVTNTADNFLESGLITKDEKEAIVSATGKSETGKKENPSGKDNGNEKK